MTSKLHGRRRFGAVFRCGARAPGQDSRPRPPAPCTSDRCWRPSAAISTRAANGARWLVRIEDLDTPRVVPGCADDMLRTLEAFGFEWDGEVLFQSSRRAAYGEALDALAAAGRTFRVQLFAQGSRRPRRRVAGIRARAARTHAQRTHRAALPRERPRLSTSTTCSWARRISISPACGDVVVQRRDGTRELPARGGGRRRIPGSDARGARRRPAGEHAVADRPAGGASLPRPIYGHLPLLLEPDGAKLSKSAARCRSIRLAAPKAAHFDPYAFVAGPTPRLAHSSIKDVWNWAVAHWNPQALAGKTQVPMSA